MASASITWNPRLQQWEMERNGVIIVVPEAVYERHLSAYLKSKRLKRQKWVEVMREAVNKWRRLLRGEFQCAPGAGRLPHPGGRAYMQRAMIMKLNHHHR